MEEPSLLFTTFSWFLCQVLLIPYIFQLVVFGVFVLEISCRVSGMDLIMACTFSVVMWKIFE